MVYKSQTGRYMMVNAFLRWILGIIRLFKNKTYIFVPDKVLYKLMFGVFWIIGLSLTVLA